jgi:hypothetical protein
VGFYFWEGIMKLYLLTYDNGYECEQNDRYTIAVFDDYNKAVKFCLNNGLKECKTKGLFIGDSVPFMGCESISIDEIEVNKELNIFGEVVE